MRGINIKTRLDEIVLPNSMEVDRPAKGPIVVIVDTNLLVAIGDLKLLNGIADNDVPVVAHVHHIDNVAFAN